MGRAACSCSRTYAHGAKDIQTLLITESGDVATARALMPEVEEQAVVSQTVSEHGMGQHFDSGAIKPVRVNDGAAHSSFGGNVPAFERNPVRGGERNPAEIEAVGFRRLAVVGVGIMILTVRVMIEVKNQGSKTKRNSATRAASIKNTFRTIFKTRD